MKLHLLSDIHLEIAPFIPPKTDADVVVLAGDIYTGTRGLGWARITFPNQEIIYLAGNHEFYGHSWTGLLEALRRRAQNLGVHFLENSSVTLGGVRFLGATMWTDFALFGEEKRARAEKYCPRGSDDYSAIQVPVIDTEEFDGYARHRIQKLTPDLVRARHLDSLAWLEEQLAAPHAGPTVVVSHHMPSMLSVPKHFKEDLMSAVYASNLDGLMGKPLLWLHGHTHDSFDYEVNGTRVVCNPRGYASRKLGYPVDRPGFKPDLVIEVPVSATKQT